MRRAGLLFFFLLLLAAGGISGVPGSTRELRGRVQTPEGRPIGGAVVLHRASGLKTETGRDGHFRLILETEGRIWLEIIHPDYHDDRITVPEGREDAPLSVVLAPYIKQREEIVVTALRYPEPSFRVPAAGAVVSGEALSESRAVHLAAGVENVPGVSLLGSGGFSLVPSIRGLARNRVLFLVDFARISSDRRTGPNASFIPPEDMDRIEILRSPSSVFYGSDAIGGVFQIFLKPPDPRPGIHGRIHAAYGSVNGETGLGVSLSGRKNGFGFSLSVHGLKAGDYRNAEGVVPCSGFSQWNVTAKMVYRTEKRKIDLSLVRYRGLDIGKPALDSLTRPTWYPRENQNLLQVRWAENHVAGGEVIFSAFLNPNFLETRTDRWDVFKTRESFGRTESLDFGAHLSYNRQAGGSLRVNAGLDVSGRTDAGAVNRDVSLDGLGQVVSVFEETPYADGSRVDTGIFLSLDLLLGRHWDITGGVRWDRIHVQADPGGAGQHVRNTSDAFSGFLAASRRLSGSLILFANLSRAYRAPTLGERFYTGITGRGFIISQPELDPERSLNFDAGLKIATPRFFAALYGFHYAVDGLMERILVSEKTYTYQNVDRGRIQGGELEAEWFPRGGFKIFGSLVLARGRSVLSQEPLNDIPPLKISAGARLWVGRFSVEASVRHQKGKTDPGPAEIAIPACTLADLRMTLYLPASLHLNLVVSNVFDVLVLGRPDPDAPSDPGRNIRLGVSYSF